MNIYILFGQTASGKTAKALELADQCNGEIVNFDSRHIYKKLNIVTGKDTPINPKYKMWLYDIIDPKDIFSSVEYVDCAKRVIKEILSRGKTPILVGGTGYYLRHLLFGTPEINIQEDWGLRKRLETKTVKELQTMLKKIDTNVFEQMNNSDCNNPRRLIRRIEITQQGGVLPQPFTDTTLNVCFRNLDIHYIPFFHSSTDIVREKISLRVEERMKNGALKETRSLLKEGYTKENPGLNAIGYKQIISYLAHEISLEEAKNEWITKEVQYAKRQKTYFKKLLPHIVK